MAGDATGVITVVPFVLDWLMPPRPREALARPVELALLVVISGVVVAIMFGAPGLAPALPAQLHAEIAPLPLLVWGPLRFVRDDGSICWVRSISRPYRTDYGDVAWDGILLDVTEEKHQRDQIEYLARHDPLTELLNRTGVNELLEGTRSRARRQGQYMALCLLDVNDFKEINDHYGHSSGDAVLQTFAARIRGSMRLDEIKARVGGDEFVIVQTDVRDHHGVALACQRLNECLNQSFEHLGHRLRASASIGIAVFPSGADSGNDLLNAADHAMYRAKQGETGPVLYSREMGTTARVRTELVQELADAIERREFDVHYQSQIHVPTGEISGIEALVRWHHPKHGWSCPGQFIPLAVERGLASAINLCWCSSGC